MTEIKLIFDEPAQKKKAPKHLADLSPAERKEWAKVLGLQPFRASQVATHYFSHLSNIAEDQHHIRRTRAYARAGAAPPESGQAAAEQVDRSETRGQAKALFGQPGDSARATDGPD